MHINAQKENEMADKLQTRGNCQCCGRDQAVLRAGTMAKHGYTVEQGWFNGVCTGHSYAPMQNDRSVTDRIIAQVRAEVKTLEQRVEGLESGKLVPLTAKLGSGRAAVEVEFKDAPVWAQKECLAIAIHQTKSRIRQGEYFCEDMGKLADTYHGQPLREVKVDAVTNAIQVGSTVKVCGKLVVVTRIEFRTCRGIGPSLNGRSLEHVVWSTNGKELAYPKRFAKLVQG
jgi:hypothetical protein